MRLLMSFRLSMPSNPFIWSNGSGCVANINDWRCRHAEIGTMIQHYEIGTKQAPPEKLLSQLL